MDMKFLSYMKRRPILVSVMLFLIIVTMAFCIKIRKVGALEAFGGQVLYITECTCTDGALALTIGTPTPGTYVDTPGTTMYKNYNFFNTGTWLTTGDYTVYTPDAPGPWVLGSYVPTTPGAEDTCWIAGVDSCYPLGTQGVINEVGTSL